MLRYELVVLDNEDKVILQTILSGCDESDSVAYIEDEARAVINKYVNTDITSSKPYYQISRWYVKEVNVIIDIIR